MEKRFITIDIGCRECSVSTEIVGVFKTREEAEKAGEKQDQKTDCWREGGQSGCEVFEIEV